MTSDWYPSSRYRASLRIGMPGSTAKQVLHARFPSRASPFPGRFDGSPGLMQEALGSRIVLIQVVRMQAGVRMFG
jgi:hypothetical protein